MQFQLMMRIVQHLATPKNALQCVGVIAVGNEGISVTLPFP
jgi:protein involved in ribonucleotide reduction